MDKITRLLELVALALFLPARAVAGPEAYIKYGPWVHGVTENSFNVLWVSEKPSLGFVEIKENDDTSWYMEERERVWQVVAGRKYVGRYHCVKVTGLKPGTEYQYKITQQQLLDASHPNAWSFGKLKAQKKPRVVRTLDPEADSCRFAMVNDVHFDKEKLHSLTRKADGIDFLVMNGDITSNARNIDTLIDYTFSPVADVLAKSPVVFVRGNHEGRGEDWYKLPGVFPTATGEFYYSFRQGPAAFIVLDAGEDKPDTDIEYSGTAAYDGYRADELEWLKEEVRKPYFAQAPVKICLIHIPTLVGKHCWYTQRWITANFMPVLNEAGIDLMLSGHHHKFAYYPENSFGNGYPVYVNSNEEMVDVNVKTDRIEIRSYDSKGKETHRHIIDK